MILILSCYIETHRKTRIFHYSLKNGQFSSIFKWIIENEKKLWKNYGRMQWCGTDKLIHFQFHWKSIALCYRNSFQSNYAAFFTWFNLQFIQSIFSGISGSICKNCLHFVITMDTFKPPVFCSFACFEFIFSVEITGVDVMESKIRPSIYFRYMIFFFIQFKAESITSEISDRIPAWVIIKCRLSTRTSLFALIICPSKDLHQTNSFINLFSSSPARVIMSHKHH